MRNHSSGWSLIAMAIVVLVSATAEKCPPDPAKWFQLAASFCEVGASMCKSLGQAIPADSDAFSKATLALGDAALALRAWSPDAGVLENTVSELRVAETIIGSIVGIPENAKTLVNIALTAIEQALTVISANLGAPEPANSGAPIHPTVAPVSDIAKRTSGFRNAAPEELRRRFNALAPSAGAGSI